MKVSQYALLAKSSPQDLSEAVNDLIAKGWQPFESPSHCEHSGGNWWMQPMVVYESSPSLPSPAKAGKK